MNEMTESQALILTRVLSDDFYFSPLKFALWAYSWDEGDLKGFSGPRKWQQDVMLDIERYLIEATAYKIENGKAPDYYRHAIASGRGPGKSALEGMLSHWFMSTRPGGSVWIAANGAPQLQTKTFPEIAKWVSRGINSEFFETNSMSIQPKTWFKNYLESKEGLSRSTKYHYISGQLWSEETPDAFAGAHNFDGEFALFDEASGIPDKIWMVQEGVFTENIVDRFWITFSNPRKNVGSFYECFNKNKYLWRNTQIDARTVENISHSTYENIIRQHGEDSNEARVEVYGQFPSVGDDQFISPRLVDEALDRLPITELLAPIVMGVDVARFGSDSTIFAIRKGSTLVAVIRHKGLDTMQVSGKVIEAMIEWKPHLTIVDEGGLGAGVLDRLKELGHNVRGVSFGSRADNPIAYFNKRSEMWGTMRNWLHTASIGNMGDNPVTENKIIKNDLIAPRYKNSSNGSVILESKADMKKRGIPSQDVGDALALTLAYPVGSGVLDTQKFRLWSEDIPRFIKVIQAYHGKFMEPDASTMASATTWGVFDHQGLRRVMLLDSWSETMGYNDLRQRIIKDWHSLYGGGNQASRKSKADMVLLGKEDVGELMIQDMRSANIIVPKYTSGDADLIERAHQAAVVIEEGVIYIPESKKDKGKPTRWSNDLIEQCDRFPNDEETGLVDTMTRVLNYVKDAELLKMPVAEYDAPEDDFDYHNQHLSLLPNINPYSC